MEGGEKGSQQGQVVVSAGRSEVVVVSAGEAEVLAAAELREIGK